MDFESGSFRDPKGRVLDDGQTIIRVIEASGAADFTAARDSGVLDDLVRAGRLVDFEELPEEKRVGSSGGDVIQLRHSRLPFISYPYEWSFSLLKKAAVFHLELQLDLLDRGFVLSDATAYNVQFQGVKPIFIDHLSIRPYREGEYWLAHNQFCEQFLNPLLLTAYYGIPHNEWFRGRLEGIPSIAIARTSPWYRKLSLRYISHVGGPARVQSQSEKKHVVGKISRPLPKLAYQGFVRGLKKWIVSLEPKGMQTVWNNYEQFNTYSDSEENAKSSFIKDFVKKSGAGIVWDLGCNTGDYSEAALSSGARKVIGFDFDHGSLNQAYARAETGKLDYLPLFLDASNPSPNQGWAQSERKGLSERNSADAIIALAFIHHLSIGKNIPVDMAVEWLVSMAPSGVIEWVQKDDSTVREMLALREDVFEGYTEEAFRNAMSKFGSIVSEHRNAENGRLLVAYERK